MLQAVLADSAGKREKVSKAFTAHHPNTALYPVPHPRGPVNLYGIL
jgi:hypothetical protein